MESVVECLKIIRKKIFRIKLLPYKLWFNKRIGNYTFIDKRYISLIGLRSIKIGEGSKIMAGLRLEAVPDYCGVKFNPKIVIGDSVCINQNFHCTCASNVEIGDGTSITANCGVFDIEHPYDDINVNPRLQKIVVKPVRIGKNCLIGMNSVILPGVTLGNHCIVGANSTVREGIYQDYCVLVGSPAIVVKRFDVQTRRWRKTNRVGEIIE